MFKQFKVYFLIAAFFAIAIGAWAARGWYEDGKIVTALEKQKEAYEEQAEKDANALTKALAKEEYVRTRYRNLQNEANKTKLCSNGGNDFLRLFNRSTINANSKE